MRIGVIAVLNKQEPLHESALAAAEKRSPKMSLESTAMPQGLTIDASVSAIPLGSGGPGPISMNELEADNSGTFGVRAYVDVESMSDVPTQINGVPIFADPLIEPFAYCGNAAQGTSNDVRTRLNAAALQAKGLDGKDVAIAIVDTGINLAHLGAKLGGLPRFDAANSWRPQGVSTAPGAFPVSHGTMCAFDALIMAPNATLLDYALLTTTLPGGSMAGSTISAALQAYAHLLANYSVAFAPGGTHQKKGLVVSNSWGLYHPSWDFPAGHPGRYCDNPNHPFAGIVATMTRAGIDFVFAAGNCGAQCPSIRCQSRTTGTIMGASAYGEVMTVAAALVTNDDRLGYSSQGPSIANMPQQKPDLTAYSHFVGSDAYGVGVPDTGTSTACPVAAGCVAALRTRLPASTCPPANLIAQFQTTARPRPGTSPGWNGDYGYGIIDPVAAANSLGL